MLANKVAMPLLPAHKSVDPLIKKLRKKKKECPPMRNLTLSRHLRDMITVPEMAGSIVGVYNVFQVNK